MTRLTPRQLQILALIWQGIYSFRRLADAMGYPPNSNGTVHWNLDRLKERGFVSWEWGLGGTLRLTEAGRQAIAGYVLGPGGYVGEWEAKEELCNQ